ncbi:hypothetical protein VRB95_19395 [Erwinia aphidicola]|uniref:hypothetical protein n=1 Tax=Erwinia aphidicola TaxID=68334 RepID=UPI0030CEB724
MSSPQNTIEQHNAAVERLTLELGKRLHEAAGRLVREKLASGEIKIVDGRYVGECLKPAKRPPGRTKLQTKASWYQAPLQGLFIIFRSSR